MSADETQLARDRALVERMRRGEERAVSEFCRTYLSRLYRFALLRVPTAEDADDVVQVALATAARRIETFRGDSTLYSWLVAICRREVGRCLAAAARRRSMIDPDQGDAALEGLEASEDVAPERLSSQWQRARRVHDCLARLPERYARVLELKYMDGYGSREIAGMIGISDEAVQSLLARARRTFREVCDDELREELQPPPAGPRDAESPP